MPATNELRSGTCASTLLPRTRSALPPVGAELAWPASRRRTSPAVGDAALDRAALATLAAGSMPRHGMPRLTKYCRR